MLRGREAEVVQALKLIPFNSLFEMQHYALFLRAEQGYNTFNSLFEMLSIEDTLYACPKICVSFNSLFEMRR